MSLFLALETVSGSPVAFDGGSSSARDALLTCLGGLPTPLLKGEGWS